MATVQMQAPVSRDDVPQRRRRHWLWSLMAWTLLALALAWGAPLLVAHTPLLGTLLGWAAADLNGSVACESASLDWFSPVDFSNVVVRDAQGNEVLSVPRARSEKTLLALALAPARPGRLHVHEPQLNVVLDEQGSNVEELLAKILQRDAGSSGRVTLDVEIHDASLAVTDGEGRKWTATKVNSVVSVAERISCSLAGLVTDDEVARTVAAEFSIDRADDGGIGPGASGPPARGEAVLKTDALSLDLLEPFVRRFDDRFRIAGRLSADLAMNWTWTAERREMRLRGKAGARALAVSATALGKDRVRLDDVTLPVDVAWNGVKVDLKEFDLQSEVGRLTLRGSAPLTDVAPAALLSALAGAQLEGSAKLDIPRVAAMIPETLRVRPGTQITGGELTASLSTRSEGTERITASQFHVTSLTATYQGRAIAWDDPMHFVLDLRDGPAGRVLKNLECRSSFLTAQAAGTPERGTARLDADLGRLMRELRPFFALDAVELAGTAAAKLDWNRAADGVFGTAADAKLVNFQFVSPSSTPWREPLFTAKFSATGTMEQGKLKSLYTANLQLDADSDQLRAQLTKPVFELAGIEPWPLSVRLQGRLGSWLSRLRPVVSPPAMEIDGLCDLTASARVSSDAIEIADVKASIDKLRLRGAGLAIEEPSVQIEGAGRYIFAERRMAFDKATFVSTVVSASGEQLTISLPSEGPPSAQGSIAFRADLGRLQRWIAAAQGAAFAVSGSVLGRAQFTSQGPEASVELETDVTDARLVAIAMDAKAPQTPTVVWSDPRVRLTAALTHQASAGRVRLARFEVTSSSLRVSAAGELTELSTRPHIDVLGQLDYDWEAASGLLRPLLGDGVRLTGRGPEQFSVRGPLASWRDGLVADATVGWSTAQAYGLKIGSARVHSHLERGRVAIDPLDVSIQEGRFTLAPELSLKSPQPTLLIPKGPVLTQVPLTPELCRAAFKFVHPFVVGVASVDGRISLAMEGASIPLGKRNETDAAGRLTIHSVRIGPGALLNHLLPVLLQPSPRNVPLLPDVDFWIKQGRVYHRGVGVVLGGVTIRTTGSVGFDESIDLVAEIPLELLPAKLKVSGAMRSQSLKIPIRGTLATPALDVKEFQRLLRESAANTIRDELLDRILKPREPK